MKVIRFAFKYNASRKQWMYLGRRYDGLYLYGIRPRCWWDLPTGVKTIWLSLHDKSSVDRYPMKVELAAFNEYLLLRTHWGAYLHLAVGRSTLRQFAGRKLYLQCEYEI